MNTNPSHKYKISGLLETTPTRAGGEMKMNLIYFAFAVTLLLKKVSKVYNDHQSD
jgi:hypothetical protein